MMCCVCACACYEQWRHQSTDKIETGVESDSVSCTCGFFSELLLASGCFRWTRSCWLNLKIFRQKNRQQSLRVGRHVAEKPQRRSVEEETPSNFPFHFSFLLPCRTRFCLFFVRHTWHWALFFFLFLFFLFAQGWRFVSVGFIFLMCKANNRYYCRLVSVDTRQNSTNSVIKPLAGSPSTFHALKTRIKIAINMQNDHWKSSYQVINTKSLSDSWNLFYVPTNYKTWHYSWLWLISNRPELKANLKLSSKLLSASISLHVVCPYFFLSR